MKRIALFAFAGLVLASCGQSQPLIGTGSCNGHRCPGEEATGSVSTGTSAAALSGAAQTGAALTGTSLPAATGAATPSASSEVSAAGAPVPSGIAVGEPNPSAPAASGEALPVTAAPTGSGAPWTFPATMPAHRAQWLETPLVTPDDITARINAEGGWRYWHTLRKLPDGTRYFFVVGPTEKPDQAGWYADFQVPAASGSGAWLISVLLETTPAKPQAYAGLADMYRGLMKSGGIPAGAPLDAFKAAAEAVQARISAE